MRFLLTPSGSHGDVHPYVGIGRRLKGRGHDVVVLSAGTFRGLVESAGLEFVETLSAAEFRRLTEDPDLWHPQRGLKLVMTTASQNVGRGYRLIEKVYRDGDVLVMHLLSVAARVFHEKHGVPGATIQLAPTGIRSVHQIPPLIPGIDLSGWPLPLKRIFWWIADRAVDRYLLPGLNELRADLGLKPIHRPFAGWLNSPELVIALFPDWFGGSPPDWPPQVVEVGFPLYDEADLHGDDAALETFLAGSRGDGGPIVLTPGSANRHGREFFAAGLDAAERLGKAALCLTAYPEQLPDPLPAFAFHARYAPFSRVFPRCCAVVHHGGIGTLGQAMAAARPQLVTALGFDQPDNGERLRRLGVGAWMPASRVRADRIAEELDRLLSSAEVARACAGYRDAIAGEDAIGRACRVLEELGQARGRAGC